MSPILHYWLGRLTFAVPIFAHSFVVWRWIYWLELRVLSGIEQVWGIEAETIESELLIVLRVCVHSIAIVLEWVLAFALFSWVVSKCGLRCPACGAPMKIIDKWFQPITTYFCTQCQYRRRFKQHDGGGG